MKQSLILPNQLDSYLNVKYDLYSMNARELATYLKNNLGDEYKKHNPSKYEESHDIPELYEYQPFFLYKKDGEFKLLDGFRRLLWYNVPDINIIVRVYKDLSDVELLELMINLNHFKFFSNQNYYDRGFSLFMKTFFDLDITENRELFDLYLSTKSSISGFRGTDNPKNLDKNILVKKRILTPYFISDIRFLFKLKESGYCVVSTLSAIIHNLRAEIGNKLKLDVDSFIDRLNQNVKMAELSMKLKNTLTTSTYYASNAKYINTLTQFYEKIIREENGYESKITYTEEVDQVKELIAKYKKDKKWRKLTNIQGDRKNTELILDKIGMGKKINFTAIIYPSDKDVTRWGDSGYKKVIPSGEHKDLKYEIKSMMGRTTFSPRRAYLEISNELFRLHSLSVDKYNEVETLGEYPHVRQKCEIFYQIID